MCAVLRGSDLCVCVGICLMYTCVLGAVREVSYPPGLEWQVVVSHHVDAGNRTRSGPLQEQVLLSAEPSLQPCIPVSLVCSMRGSLI